MSLAGTNVGNYKIVDVLGAGGMATVYRATQTNIEREVAIKVMAEAFSRQPDFVERFKREAELFAKLEHPHILPIYDYGDDDGYLYLVLRLMEGGSLERHVRRNTFDLPQIGKVIEQVGAALDYAHQRNVVHRDLKPNNILLDDFNNAYLMDFGIAKIISGVKLTATGTLLGTPAYMAPEMWKLDPIDGRSDIYSLGLMLYEILAGGELPFRGETPFQFMYAHLHEEVPSISQQFDSYTTEMDEVLLKATAKEPDDRYNTAAEMAEAFNTAIRNAETPLALEKKSGKWDTSDRLGKIFVVLEHSSSGLAAVPRLDDFVSQQYKDKTMASKQTSAIDDIFGTLEASPDSETINTDQVQAVLSQGKMSEAFLGVSAQPLQLPPNLLDELKQQTGLLVIGVEPGSPAEVGGMHIGDILVQIAEQTIQNQDDLKAVLRDEHIGVGLLVKIVRAGHRQELTITLRKA